MSREIEALARQSVTQLIKVSGEFYSGATTSESLKLLFSEVTETAWWGCFSNPLTTALWTFRYDLEEEYWTVEHFRYADQIDSRNGW